MGYYVKNRRLQSGSSGVVLPAGGAAVRPLSPTFGLMRFNTDTAKIEFFNGSSYVSLAQAGPVDYSVDQFVGDGSTTVFTMSVAESLATQVIVFVGSIYQEPGVAYNMQIGGGFDITFTSPPPSGEPISVIHASID
jgi:hypothetical protein